MSDPFQAVLDAMQNELIEAVLSSAEAAHEASMKAPLMSVKFNASLMRQLIDNHAFGFTYAALIVLNTNIPPAPVELTDAHIDRTAAMAAEGLNRLYEEMVAAGFPDGEALCAYVGKQA